MRFLLIIFVASLLVYSCNQEENKEKTSIANEFIKYNSETGELIVDLEKADKKGLAVNQVLLAREDNNTFQNLILKGGVIERMENLKNVDYDPRYVNTWMEFDRQGNLIYDQSYYFETFLDRDDSSLFVDCFLNNSFFHDNIYAVVGKYSKSFVLDIDSPVDTFFFDENNKFIRIPLPEWEEGKNNIRFVLYDDTFENGEVKRRMSFVDKDFFVKNPDDSEGR